MARRVRIDSLVSSLLGPEVRAEFNEIRAIFRMCEIAEEEIEDCCKRHGEPANRDSAIWRQSFLVCKPPEHVIFVGLREEVFRSHCRELCERVANGADTRLGTEAEVMLGLKGASLIAPLNSHACGLYAYCFKRILGEYADEQLKEALDEMERYEDWKGQKEETLAECRHKMRQEWRVLTERPRKGNRSCLGS